MALQSTLEGDNALRIQVKQLSVGGNGLPKWPGGGSIYLSLEETRQRGFLFRSFCDNFDKVRLRMYLTIMERRSLCPIAPSVSSLPNASAKSSLFDHKTDLHPPAPRPYPPRDANNHVLKPHGRRLHEDDRFLLPRRVKARGWRSCGSRIPT
jgi:hypothetical protein